MKDVEELEGILKLPECQASLHRWGAAKHVKFDPSKEEFVVIMRRTAIGKDFRLLGVLFDAQLVMHRGVRKTWSALCLHREGCEALSYLFI